MNIKLIIKGFIVGIGKIIPGVSGSMLAITLGIYEKIIDAITDFTSNIKENLIFLINVGIGVFIAIILFSKLLLYLLSNYYNYTIYLFVGLIIGTLIRFQKNIKINKKNSILFIISLGVMLSMSFLKTGLTYHYMPNLIHNLYVGVLGVIDAATMIIPGISGTAIFILLGVYEFVLSLFSNPFSFLFLLYAFGLFIGIIMISYLMKYLLKKKKEETYAIIMAFSIGSVILLLIDIISFIKPSLMIMMLIGVIGGYFFDKE